MQNIHIFVLFVYKLYRKNCLPISFCSVVRLTEHLTVSYICSASLAPCSHMISIHISKPPYLVFVGFMPHSTVRTVRDSLFFCFYSLLSIDSFLRCFVEYTDFEEFCVSRTTEDIFENSFTIFDVRVTIESSYFFRNLSGIVGGSVIHLIEPSPLESTHFFFYIDKNSRSPVDHSIKIRF